MNRSFEELGVAIGGIGYGLFTGEAQFDQTGSVVQIDIERGDFGGSHLTLDIETLILERIALRRLHGSNFLEDTSYRVREHLRMFVLFQALAETIEANFAEDGAGSVVGLTRSAKLPDGAL